jgi:oxygen-independent coproporphyrinogen-3 oxidase
MSGVYISYPFCAQKCTFCNFASGVHSLEARRRYEHALLEEVRRHAWLWAPQTLYFGGGTPSLAPLDFLRGLLGSIPCGGVRESTLECAPGTLTPEAAHAWPEIGINRISLGVQSFVTEELRRTGRVHTAETVEREIGVLRESGIDNINIDLIAGLPGQTLQSWRASLDWLERLAPAHASVYIFEVDENSRLGEEILRGGTRYGAADVPSEDLIADLYELAVERLALLGLARYEISNFARPGFESRHNLKYWRLEPYIGFGLDAHSFDGAWRWSNPESLDGYLSAYSVERTATDRLEERFFIGLRLMSGVEPEPEEWSRFAGPIGKWLAAGMLERTGSRLRLSSRGVLVSNEVFQDFIHD